LDKEFEVTVKTAGVVGKSKKSLGDMRIRWRIIKMEHCILDSGVA
jgi:hypothetical protein